MRSKLFLLSFAAICLLFSVAANAQSYAITNAKIVTVSGATIDKGTVVIRNGIITAVGASVSAPADVQVFDATGLTVYPGFIDSLTNLGIPARAVAPGSTTTRTTSGTRTTARRASRLPDAYRRTPSATVRARPGTT